MTNYKKLCAELVEVLSLNDYYDEQAGDMSYRTLLQRARDALAQHKPEPEEPTKAEIHAIADALLDGDSASRIDFALAVLARWGTPNSAEVRRSLGGAPQPIPVSERLPGPGDCLDEGWAWFFNPRTGWRQATQPVHSTYTHWLPAHALPIPTHTSEND